MNIKAHQETDNVDKRQEIRRIKQRMNLTDLSGHADRVKYQLQLGNIKEVERLSKIRLMRSGEYDAYDKKH